MLDFEGSGMAFGEGVPALLHRGRDYIRRMNDLDAWVAGEIGCIESKYGSQAVDSHRAPVCRKPGFWLRGLPTQDTGQVFRLGS